MNRLKRVFRHREVTALMFLVALFAMVTVFDPAFLFGDAQAGLAPGNGIATSLNESIVVIVMSVGMAFAIFVGEIDVSVGSTLGLVAAVVGTMMQNGESWVKAFAIGLLIGLAVGLVNAFGVAILKIPSLIFTLGTNGVLRGLMYPIVGKGGSAEVTNLPLSFKGLSSKGVIGPLSILFACVVVLVVVVHLVLTRTKRGRYFIAVGDNAGGADLVGIPATRTKVVAYIICALLAAVAGILFCSKAGRVTFSAGNGYEMTAVAACVLGGISLSGGVGSVVGAAIGAVIMSSVETLLYRIKLPSDYTQAITGVILLAIVVSSALVQHRSEVRTRHLRLSARTAAGEEAGTK